MTHCQQNVIPVLQCHYGTPVLYNKEVLEVRSLINHDALIMIYNGDKIGHNGPEETTYIEQGVGQHIEMITVNGWCAGGMGRGNTKLWCKCSVNRGDLERLLS